MIDGKSRRNKGSSSAVSDTQQPDDPLESQYHLSDSALFERRPAQRARRLDARICPRPRRPNALEAHRSPLL